MLGWVQINAFGPDCHAGGQPLYEIFTDAVQLLQKLQYSPYPMVPFSRMWYDCCPFADSHAHAMEPPPPLCRLPSLGLPCVKICTLPWHTCCRSVACMWYRI